MLVKLLLSHWRYINDEGRLGKLVKLLSRHSNVNRVEGKFGSAVKLFPIQFR